MLDLRPCATPHNPSFFVSCTSAQHGPKHCDFIPLKLSWLGLVTRITDAMLKPAQDLTLDRRDSSEPDKNAIVVIIVGLSLALVLTVISRICIYRRRRRQTIQGSDNHSSIPNESRINRSLHSHRPGARVSGKHPSFSPTLRINIYTVMRS